MALNHNQVHLIDQDEDIWDDELLVKAFDKVTRKVDAAIANKQTDKNSLEINMHVSHGHENHHQDHQAEENVEIDEQQPIQETGHPQPQASVQHSCSMKTGPSVGTLLPPPPTSFVTHEPSLNEDDSLASMLMSWYMSGYHTGYYKAMKHFRSQCTCHQELNNK